jgi:chaperonin GroEL
VRARILKLQTTQRACGAHERARPAQDLNTDEEMANVACVSAGNNKEIGGMISKAMARVGWQGVITMEESRTAEDNLYVVEGMQFERGFVSPYFVTDPERMIAEYEGCNVLLVDKKISSAREIVGLLEQSIRSGKPLMIMAEDFEQARASAGGHAAATVRGRVPQRLPAQTLPH